MKVILLILLLLAAAAGQEIPGKRYSYVCTNNNDRLCVGISPGNQLISQNEKLMLKDRIRNEQNGFDFVKLRWDLSLTGLANFFLSSDSRYCIQRRGTSDQLVVKRSLCDTKAAQFNTTQFLRNTEMVGAVQHVGTKKCWTVMQCLYIVNNGKKFCDPTVNVPERSGIFQDTAYIRLWPCFFNPTRGNLMDMKAQLFKNRLDCVPGCTVVMQENNFCDDACNTELCDMDNGRCDTKSPTPPTVSPTNYPSFSPTLLPTITPSVFPTISPTKNPSSQPSLAPSTAPSNSPTLYPTVLPSRNPSNAPTVLPSVSPSSAPSYNPSRNPTNSSVSPTSPKVAAADNLLWLLWLLVILCCCFPFCFWYRRSREKKKKETPADEEENVLEEEQVLEAINREIITRHSTPPMPETPPPPAPPAPPSPITLPSSEKVGKTMKMNIDVNNINYKRENGSFVRAATDYRDVEVPADDFEKVVNEMNKKLLEKI